MRPRSRFPDAPQGAFPPGGRRGGRCQWCAACCRSSSCEWWAAALSAGRFSIRVGQCEDRHGSERSDRVVLVPEQLAGDDKALDLAGPFVDGGHAHVAIVALDGKFADVSVAAVRSVKRRAASSSVAESASMKRIAW